MPTCKSGELDKLIREHSLLFKQFLPGAEQSAEGDESEVCRFHKDKVDAIDGPIKSILPIRQCIIYMKYVVIINTIMCLLSLVVSS